MFGTLQKEAWATEAASRTKVNALFMAGGSKGVQHADPRIYLSIASLTLMGRGTITINRAEPRGSLTARGDLIGCTCTASEQTPVQLKRALTIQQE